MGNERNNTSSIISKV